jgi:4-hydroxybenzoate polyprenyltransferase
MPEKLKLYLESLRLDRWPRSLAIFPGFIAVAVLNPHLFKTLNTAETILKLFLAFCLTWFISTANYIVNEITDAPFDAFHPQKKNRPLINNKINKKKLLLLWILLVGVSVIVALTYYNTSFLISLLILLLAGIIYNVPPVRVKDIPFLDSTVESANNPIRFLIGWYVVESSFPLVSLLVAWWGFGNFLMVGKRVAEKKFLTQEESSGYRQSLKKYSPRMLFVFMILNAIIFIITFALFAVQTKLYSFLYSIPFILVYLILFTQKIFKDREGAEEPEKLLKNPVFALYTLFMAIIFLLAYILR